MSQSSQLKVVLKLNNQDGLLTIPSITVASLGKMEYDNDDNKRGVINSVAVDCGAKYGLLSRETVEKLKIFDSNAEVFRSDYFSIAATPAGVIFLPIILLKIRLQGQKNDVHTFWQIKEDSYRELFGLQACDACDVKLDFRQAELSYFVSNTYELENKQYYPGKVECEFPTSDAVDDMYFNWVDFGKHFNALQAMQSILSNFSNFIKLDDVPSEIFLQLLPAISHWNEHYKNFFPSKKIIKKFITVCSGAAYEQLMDENLSKHYSQQLKDFFSELRKNWSEYTKFMEKVLNKDNNNDDNDEDWPTDEIN